MKMNSLNDKFLKTLEKIDQDLSSGLLYTHTRINADTAKILEAS